MKVKIFIPYHRQTPLLKEDCFHPIHVGRSLAVQESKDGQMNQSGFQWLMNNMVGDDSGKNISSLNREFCENTALYWAWKNALSEDITHIGFMQYRRHFIFNDLFDKSISDLEKEAYGCIHFRDLLDNHNQKIDLTESSIKDLLDDYDVVLPMPGNLEAIGMKSLWDDYVSRISGSHIDDLIELLNVVSEYNSDLGFKLERYLDGKIKLMYQMIILSKIEYQKYCEFLFPLLFEVNKRLDVSMYSMNGKRTIGYLSEFLYGLYFMDILRERKLKIIHKGIVFLDEV